jgi:MFS family permease
MFQLTHSPAWLGTVGFALSGPALVLAPFSGALCDRFGHRRTALFSTLSGMTIVLVTAIITGAGWINPPLLVFLILLLGISISIEFPARQALVPGLLAREILTEGMALNWAVFNVGFFTGPLFAGLMLSAGGPGIAFLAAAGCYTCMATALATIDTGVDEDRSHSAPTRFLDDMKAGIRYTTSHARIPAIIGVLMIVSLLIRPYVDLMPGFAGAVFDRAESGLATLLAGSGIGALVVAVAMTLYGKERWLIRVLVGGSILSSIALFAFANTPDFALAVAVLFVVGGSTTAAGIANATLIQHEVDPAFRGRVVSLNMAFQLGTPALGSLSLGWLAEFVGLQKALAGAAVVVLIAVAIFSRKLRFKPAGEPSP